MHIVVKHPPSTPSGPPPDPIRICTIVGWWGLSTNVAPGFAGWRLPRWWTDRPPDPSQRLVERCTQILVRVKLVGLGCAGFVVGVVAVGGAGRCVAPQSNL